MIGGAGIGAGPPQWEDRDAARRSALEQVRQQRAEHWIFVRELAIVLIVAAAVAVRLLLGG